ncbi:pheromone-regulated membrane protein [Apiospora arundinis]
MSDNSPPAGSSPATNNGIKKEKGRVRFNSTAGGEPPREIPSPVDDYNEKQRNLSPVRRPRPSLLRGSSYNSVLDADVLTPQEPLSPAAISAIAAHQRAQEVAANMLGSSHSRPVVAADVARFRSHGQQLWGADP